MSIKKIFKILPYFAVSWAVRNRGSKCELHAVDRDGNAVIEKVRLMHVHGGEYIAFSEHVQELHERNIASKQEQKNEKRKKQIEEKSIKIIRDINSDYELRKKVVNDIKCLYGKDD